MGQRFREDLPEEFVAERKTFVEKEITRYLDRARIKEELGSSDVSAYTLYKQKDVVPQLEKVLKAITNKTYGICVTCGSDIEIERLKCVATALDCMTCIQKYKR